MKWETSLSARSKVWVTTQTSFKIGTLQRVAPMRYRCWLRLPRWSSKWSLLTSQKSYLEMRWPDSRPPYASVSTMWASQWGATKSNRSLTRASTSCLQWFPTCTKTGWQRTCQALSKWNFAKAVRRSSHDPKAPHSTTWWTSRKTQKKLTIFKSNSMHSPWIK